MSTLAPDEPEGTILLTRDVSTGHLHKRVVMGDGLASLEGCNLDQSGAFVVLCPMSEVAVGDLNADVCCRNCFPELARA